MRSLIIKIAIASGAAVIGLVYISLQRPSRQQTDKFFHTTQTTVEKTTLTTRQQQLIGVQYALREGNIPMAIDSFPTKTAKDFYNRATLQTIRAYDLLIQGDPSYKTIMQNAAKDFAQAASQTTNIYLSKQIHNNKNIHTKLDHIGTITFCFDDFSTLLDSLSSIHKTIQDIRTSIDTQLQTLNNQKTELTNTIGPECRQNINNTLHNTQSTLHAVQEHIDTYNRQYLQTFQQYIQDPGLCFQTDIQPLLRDTTQTQKALIQQQETYAITQLALQTQNTMILEQICQQTQDDTLNNQELEKSLQQLIKNLEQSTQQQERENSQPEASKENPKSQGPTNNTPQYIPLTQEEEDTLKQIQQNNIQRIDTMIQIKKNHYDPSETLQTIFDIFYGDTSEFTIPGW